MNKEKILNIKTESYKLRLKILRIIYNASSSHLGSCYSIIDALFTLYKSLEDKKILKNSKIILSKGHAAAAFYTVLQHFKFISKNELNSFYKDGSKLMGHASHYVNGVILSTGSLGHGPGVGCGIAYALKKQKKKDDVYVFISDGECNEGSVWEALLFASHHKLNNLKIIIDYNKLQSIHSTIKTLNIEPIKKKLDAFGFKVTELDGHNIKKLYNYFNKKIKTKKPQILILHTVKGKGVSFMENNNLWHYRTPNNKEFQMAKNELENKLR